MGKGDKLFTFHALKAKLVKNIYFPPQTTGYFQPLDLAVFAVVKSKYRKWLARRKLFGECERRNGSSKIVLANILCTKYSVLMCRKKLLTSSMAIYMHQEPES